MTQLVPVAIPRDLKDSFQRLSNIPVYFIDYIVRISKSGKKQKRVIAVTSTAVLICKCSGDLLRCVALCDIAEVVYSGHPDEKHFGIKVPFEGDQIPSFDLLFRTGQPSYLANVLRSLTRVRRQEVHRSPAVFTELPSSADFPMKRFNLQQPEDWSIAVSPAFPSLRSFSSSPSPSYPPLPANETESPGHHARSDSAPSPPKQVAGAPSSPHSPQSWRPSSRSEPWSPATDTERSGDERGGDSLSRRQLAHILKKLQTIETEIHDLKAQSDRGGGGTRDMDEHLTTRELSLRAFEELKAIRRELASEGLLAPTQAWSDVYHKQPPGAARSEPPSLHEASSPPPDSIPVHMGGVDGYLVPASSAAARMAMSHGARPRAIPRPFVEPQREIDDDLPPPPVRRDIGPEDSVSQAALRLRSPSPSDPYCAYCGRNLGNEDPLPRCSVCRVAVYCNRQCQLGHWGSHRLVCGSLAADTASSSSSSSSPRRDEHRRPHIVVVQAQSPPPPPPAPAPPPSRPIQTPPKEHQRLPLGLGVAPSAAPPPGGARSVTPPRGKSSQRQKSSDSAIPTPSKLAPNAQRDRVYDTNRSAIQHSTTRPPVPPPPPQVMGLDYEQLFSSYRKYYTDLLLSPTTAVRQHS